MSEAGRLSKEAIARIEELVQRADSLPDPAARATTIELVQAVMDVHSAALQRIIEILSVQGDLAGLLSDQLVSSILVLHAIHPENVATRVARVMDRLSRHLDSRGGGIELVDLDPDTIRVRYVGKHRNTVTRQLIEDAISEAAPEVTSIVIEGIEEESAAGFVPLSVLTAAQT